MADDPIPALERIENRLSEVADELGLPLDAFALVYDRLNERFVVQAAFHLDPKVAFASNEQRAFDRQFAEMALAERRAGIVKQVSPAIANLQSMMDDLDADDGIGLDD